MLSVSPSLRWILAVGVPAVVGPLLPPLLVRDMTTADRWLFVGVSAAFALGMLAVSRNRITVRDALLSQRGALLCATFRLERLASVHVSRGPGQYNHPWQMALTDVDGRRMILRLNGYEAEDRRRLMALIEPYVRRPGVRLTGPVDEALAAGLWFPHRKPPAG